MTAVARVAREAIGPGRARRALIGFGIVLVSLGALGVVVDDHSAATHGSAFDFDVNWVAANRLVEGKPLYDRDASRADASADGIRPLPRHFSDGPFTSYIGPPATALFHVPMLVADRDTALWLFRLFAAIGMMAAIAVAASALGVRQRAPAALVGIGSLLLFSATVRTLDLGQGHELVMLGLAVGIWATAKERWALAGIGLGVATMLKLSPVLLVAYLLLNRKWRAVGWASGTVVLLNTLAAAVGRPGDLWVWIRDVAPSASEGTSHIYNQAVPAWLARISTIYPDALAHGSLGGWRVLGILLASAATLGLWWTRRNRPVEPLALGVLVLVGLVAGPLTWSHYAVWAIIPLVLLADTRRWAECTPVEAGTLLATLGSATLLMHVTIDARFGAAVGTDLASRLAESPSAVALMLYLGVALRLLLRSPARAQQVEPGSTRYTAASSLVPTSVAPRSL